MRGTEHFKQAIKSYLDERAKTDELFAVGLCQGKQEFGRLHHVHTQPSQSNGQ